ncbi:MAG: efflux RND transporter permease subunit [Planctomycetes bacterium]|nr:efflux RND transporter permease subunit [Planctomycetota bacterium]
MLNAIIRLALQQRLLVVALAVLLIGLGSWQAAQMEIDVFPDLNRPRVVVITEAPGMAPEEVEALITFPLESALNGANDVLAVRSSSGVGISVIYVEFDWHTDIYTDRQIVAERLALAEDRLPPDVKPTLAPISSIMGQILMIGLWSETGETGPLELRTYADWVVRQRLLTIPGVAQVFTMGGGRKQFQVLVDPEALRRYGVTLHQVKEAVEESNRNTTGGYLDQQGPNELLVRSLGRVQSVEDLEQVVVAFREDRPVALRQVAQVKEAAQVKRGDSAAYVRVEGRESRAESQKTNGGIPRPALNPQPSTLNQFSGGPAVVLTINKQPGADTREISDRVAEAIDELRQALPDDVRIASGIYSQRSFIDRSVHNVIEALADGGVLVVVLLFAFLLNFRTTFITLTAIPLSLVVTALVFSGLGLSINTMTLGGLAVAIGELVDDAIVDVENIFRRLRENRERESPRHPLLVVFQASVEIRNSIVFGTMIVVLVFLPLFALSGMEGRLFAPLGLAYIVSILASLAVSLTVTPVLSYLLLARRRVWDYVAPLLALGMSAATFYWVLPRLAQIFDLPLTPAWPHATWEASLPALGLDGPVTIGPALFWTLIAMPAFWLLVRAADVVFAGEGEGRLLTALKSIAGGAIALSLKFPRAILLAGMAAVVVAAVSLSALERDFLPPFNEGSVQLNLILPPGTSLETSNSIAQSVDRRLTAIPAVDGFVRRTGRAELDEHAEGVHMSEIVINLDPAAEESREEILEQIRAAVDEIPGVVSSVEQPLAHLISHMLSGVMAEIGIKVYGDDLSILRRTAERIEAAIKDVPGVTDLFVEPQVTIPQLRIQIDRERLLLYGLTPEDVNEYIETAMNGRVVSQVLVGQRTFDLLVRFDERYREDLHALGRLAIELPDGGTTPLSSVAKIYESGGPNTINREKVRRRIVIQSNVSGRGLVDVVEDIRARVRPIQESLPPGYFIEYGGQFESQRDASRMIGIFFAGSLAGVFLVLYAMFGSANFALQVMVALPMAFIGSVAALVLTEQTLTVAAMVGFISLGGIASRNGILLLNHYLHLVRYEGETWSREMIVRAGKERLAPVLMTALTSGIGLMPLALAAGEAGKEILYPVATVIIGGLISSTLLEFIVRPALFWSLGREAGRRIVAAGEEHVELTTETNPTAKGL